MKNEQKIYKNEFGSFCSQFGFSQKETMPPSKQKPSRKPSKDKFYHSKRGTHDNYRMNDTKHSSYKWIYTYKYHFIDQLKCS